ncbi:hypothetical protein AcV5_009360 [Taiwanofungus camphoratus]|nr:hypothetical protein AcV5_009360 [Antrodia cinnamomea]KAI0924749.1 hypothetical protein AcW2_005537 [Antrodia cinnamomea]KAI0953890.1 hypothetical protein AcV7_007294 [Antrodia cinnamomea]
MSPSPTFPPTSPNPSPPIQFARSNQGWNGSDDNLSYLHEPFSDNGLDPIALSTHPNEAHSRRVDPGNNNTAQSFSTLSSPYWFNAPPPSHSLLMSPAGEIRQYEDSLDIEQSSSPVFTNSFFPGSLLGQAQRNLPQIRINTLPVNPLDMPPMHMASDHMRTPYEHSPMASSSRRPSSSYGSLTPITPPMTIPALNSPLINSSPISPVSPGQFDEQLPLYDHHGQGGQGEIRSVAQLAAQVATAHDGPLVPQKTYRPHTQSDRRRYVEEVQLEAPIMFYVQNPSGCGISLRDALNSKFMRLQGRDDLMFSNRGPSVSIRLMWPGYAPWSRQIPTRDFRSPPGPITRSKLAKNVAKTIQRFIDEMQNRRMEEEAEVRWRVGRGHIDLDDLILVGLQHVSMGSWQAHVRLR